ncbi:MAG TPA: O-antigen ligase family protein [Trueperaceae bacterium]|nr:O-antigen ligase family protein [Trueperaceae bacterium]
MTTEQRAALLRPYAAPSGALLTTRLLGAFVAVYVAWTMVLGNVPGLSRVPHAAVLVAFALLLVRSTQTPLRLRLDAALPVAALFVAYSCASVLWSFDQSAALVSAVGLAFDFFGAVVVWAALQNGVTLRLVALSSAAAATLQGAIALYQYATLGQTRAEGLTGNANSLAIQLSMAAFLLLLTMPRNRWAGLLAAALIVVATLTTGTRKLVFVWFAYFLVLARDLVPAFRRPSIGTAFALLVAPLAVWASLTYGGSLAEPFAEVAFVERLEMTLEGRETAKRSALIDDGLEVFRREPVFGHGLDQYRHVGSFTTYTHNNYVELLANLGVVGVVLYYALFAFLGYRAVAGVIAGRRSAWVVLAILVLYLLMDLARVSYTGRITWLYLLVIAFVTSGGGEERSGADAV